MYFRNLRDISGIYESQNYKWGMIFRETDMIILCYYWFISVDTFFFFLTHWVILFRPMATNSIHMWPSPKSVSLVQIFLFVGSTCPKGCPTTNSIGLPRSYSSHLLPLKSALFIKVCITGTFSASSCFPFSHIYLVPTTY